MERLVTTSEAAKILNLSLQGVHYRIKSNQLNSIKKNGKVFVYVDESDINKLNSNNLHNENEINSLLILKDEQIELLKTVIKWHKKQYKKELIRLQKSHNELKDVFQSEIKLLQDAFAEMKKIYQQHISYHSKNQIPINKDDELISLKDFILLVKKYSDNNLDIKKTIIDKIKQKDDRFVYDKEKKEIFVHKSYFLDLV
ncbi:helix-turn-helix domain-containing protein [Arcobacter sp. FWKO B]|uniref:helix-turn-helix domain-containing protein n=1 Tax=Arcobacter sp. FWKO B TaxID=2593672 RepID=UPI0018A36CDF|nr:helix-turn-helix domain-containing protein [Arcobacter sp. FWKO B]QOG12272.1 helix-turn-helix domain-containing protein [Arcobacter sp. FWKO B]